MQIPLPDAREVRVTAFDAVESRPGARLSLHLTDPAQFAGRTAHLA
jgi:hypothetical protein